MGDYNYPDIDWENYTGSSTSSQQFLECLEDGFLTQHIKEPTRGSACLDLVIYNDPDIVNDVEIIGQFSNSDHSIIKFRIASSQTEAASNKQVLNYSKADFNKIRREIGAIQWSLQCGANEAWEDFKKKVLEVENRMIPKVTVGTKKKKAIWINQKAIKAVRAKHKAFAKYKQINHPAYVKAVKRAKKEVETARKSFESKLAINIKTDVKSFYAYARSKSKSKVGIGPLDDGVGSQISSDAGMCEIFNEYFTSVFTIEDTTNIPSAVQMWKGSNSEALSDIALDAKIVEGRLGGLRADKSTGADDLSPRLLKEIQKEIIQPVLYIWSKSIQDGNVPQDWKIANVCPIFKKGSRNEPGNYRPVSLTSQIGKLFESIIRDAIVSHLESNGLIFDSQHGFRRGRSCLSNVLTFLDKATRLIDEGEACDAIYLDFAKAFDTVPIERLLMKVENHGITGKLLKWIGEWLKDRKQSMYTGVIFGMEGRIQRCSARLSAGTSSLSDIYQRPGCWNY
jgi:hypothetical protein